MLDNKLFYLSILVMGNLLLGASAPIVKLGLNTGLDLSKIVVLTKAEQVAPKIDWPVLPSVGSGLLGLRALKKNKALPVAEITLLQLARVPGFYNLPIATTDEQLLVRKQQSKKRVRNL